jgi:hypothetical protein
MGRVTTSSARIWLSVVGCVLQCSPVVRDRAPVAPVGLRGQLLYEGKAYAVDAPIEVVATRCRESDQTSITVLIQVPASASPYKDIPLKLLDIHGDPTKAKIGVKYTTQTWADRNNPDTERDGRARVLAWVSRKGETGQSTYPLRSWVRFDRLEAQGPIDLTLEVDFGDLGRAEGRIVVKETTVETCVIPSPPPPPPPPGPG